MAKKLRYNQVPKTVELFGRTITTSDETGEISHKAFGEARYGCNQIAVSRKVGGNDVTDEEYKMTYLHEMFHFILNFTGFESIILKGQAIDIEQFVDLMASGFYQYEKTANYGEGKTSN